MIHLVLSILSMIWWLIVLIFTFWLLAHLQAFVEALRNLFKYAPHHWAMIAMIAAVVMAIIVAPISNHLVSTIGWLVTLVLILAPVLTALKMTYVFSRQQKSQKKKYKRFQKDKDSKKKRQ